MVFSCTTGKKKKEIVCVIWRGLNNRKKNILSFLPLLWKVFSPFVWTNHDLSIWLHPPILSGEKNEIIPKSKKKKTYYFVCNIFFLRQLMHWTRQNVLLKEMGSMPLKHKLLFKRPLQIEGLGFVFHYLLLAKCFFNATIQKELNFCLKWYAYGCTIIYANGFYWKDNL